MNLLMNLNDIDLWEKGLLKGFALPPGFLPEIGEVVNILEPFTKVTAFISRYENGEWIPEDTISGIKYCSDGAYAIECGGTLPYNEKYTTRIEEAQRQSPPSWLPSYAIRRKAVVTKFEYKPLRSFTDGDIKLLRLDYASQDDPQLIMEEYLPIKNFELLYGWWKQHHKATLKSCNNPNAVIIYLTSTAL